MFEQCWFCDVLLENYSFGKHKHGPRDPPIIHCLLQHLAPIQMMYVHFYSWYPPVFSPYKENDSCVERTKEYLQYIVHM
jgi:hypothetical protein